MSDSNDSLETPIYKAVVWFYLLLTILGGILTLYSILNLPTESTRTILLNLSAPRLILFLLVFGITVSAGFLFINFSINQKWATSCLLALREKLSKNLIFEIIFVISIILFIWGSNFLFQIPELTEPVTSAYYQRLQPVVIWLMILAGQTSISIFVFLLVNKRINLKKIWLRFYQFLIVFGVIVIGALLVIMTGCGLNPIDEGIGWHSFGTPILFSQLLMTWALSMVFLYFWTRTTPGTRPNEPRIPKKKDIIIISLILWISSFSLWMAQPLKANWFVSEPRPPNFQFYPSSDASVYDITAINLSLGAGFKTRGSPFTLRPLYSAFLAGLHALTDPTYESIIWIQVVFLSFIPVVLFLLLQRIHHPVTGFLVAIMYILKEMNAIRLGDSISDSHAKLLMPFLPTTLGIVLFVYVVTRWLQKPDQRKASILTAGGIIGLFGLIRPEIFVLLPAVAFAALLELRSKLILWLKGMIWIAIGLTLAIIPWLWRNYQLTGTIYIDSPHYRLDLLNRRYQEEPIGFVIPEATTTIVSPGQLEESSPSNVEINQDIKATAQPPARSTSILDEKDLESPVIAQTPALDVTQEPFFDDSIQESTRGFASEVIIFILEDPARVAGFITNHFVNNLVQSLLVLPPNYPITKSAINLLGHKSFQTFWIDCCSLIDYERRFPFWPKWDGQIPRSSVVPLTASLILIAIGIVVSWRKQKFIGIIPLLCFLSYSFINAIARNSGGRYIAPISWVSVFYFGIGLIHVSALPFSNLGDKKHLNNLFSNFQKREYPTDTNHQKTSLIIISVIIFLIAALLPLLEVVIPQRFDQESLDLKLKKLFVSQETSFSLKEKTNISEFLNNKGELNQGLALYPRFHKPYQMGSVWRIYYDRPYSHVDFYLSSPGDRGVVLPMEDPPEVFLHASEVLVVGCSQEEDIQALLVIIFNEDKTIQEILWRSPVPENPSCPLPTIQ